MTDSSERAKLAYLSVTVEFYVQIICVGNNLYVLARGVISRIADMITGRGLCSRQLL